MSKSPKLLFIGLDSAEPTLLERWSNEGLLPNIKAFQDSSAWTPIKTPPGFGNGVMWPSLLTGVNAGRHGRYFINQIRSGSYKQFLFSEDNDLKYKPFWDALSKAGKRVAIIDMVRTSLIEGLNGIQVADWTAHDRSGEARSWPPELIKEVEAKFGKDPFQGCSEVKHDRSGEEYKVVRDNMLERIEMKTKMSCDYLKKDDWDLFVTVFADPHDVGHQCWHLHDANDLDHDPDWVKQHGDPVKDIYIAIDKAVGTLLEQVGPETTVVLFTGPGMGPNYTGNFVLEKILRKLEGRPDKFGIPASLIKKLPKAFYRPLSDVNIALMEYERSTRKAFAVVHNHNSGAIRINLAGREPKGKIKPGQELDRYIEGLTKDLMAITDVHTGEPLVDEVIRISDSYHGENLDMLPDLLVVWKRDKPITAVHSPKIGELDGPFRTTRSGDHTPRAVFMVRGEGIETGEKDAVPVENVAPTITSMLGVTLDNIDGEPLEIYKEAALR